MRAKPNCVFAAIVGIAFVWTTQVFSENQPPLQIGAVSKIINPKIGDWVQSASVKKRATAIHGNLEANGLYLSDGKMQVLLVSCDLGGLEPPRVKAMREAMGLAAGIPPRNIIISATHTRGPVVLRSNYLMPVDTAYLDKLQGWLVELAQEAVQSASPGKIGWGKGVAQIGYNRRICFADGTHVMHGDTRRKDFAGLEGPDDPQHVALFAVNAEGKLIAVVQHNTTHPTITWGGSVFTADFPGESRRMLREELGNIPMLYLNGAQGDVSWKDALNPRKETPEQSIERLGRLMADETLRLYKSVKYQSHPILRHSFEDLEVKVRLPKPERLAEARKVLARIDAGENIRGMKMIMAFGAVHLQELYGENPVDTLPIHVLRIGDLALVTQPCELYSQFGLDIKRRSPASITAIVGLADGYCGYCPTIHGILGGGYTGDPISWTRLEPYAGYKIVESASKMLYSLWQSKKVGKASK
ncbi:MAG: hypothetical protein L3J39_00305 [Verrucomicrobiales bacterium]|nr:hypothetical protein [Verrucomicrobiales bacterium]